MARVKGDGKYLWLMVTPDRFELPICVADSASILADKLNITVASILSKEKRNHNGIVCGYRIRKVLRDE